MMFNITRITLRHLYRYEETKEFLTRRGRNNVDQRPKIEASTYSARVQSSLNEEFSY